MNFTQILAAITLVCCCCFIYDAHCFFFRPGRINIRIGGGGRIRPHPPPPPPPKPQPRRTFYYKFGILFNYNGALKYCLQKGGQMARVYNSQEQELIRRLTLNAGTGYYIDLKQTLDSFEFGDGKKPSQTFWATSQPSKQGDCVMYGKSSGYKLWESVSCGTLAGVICEFDKPFVEPPACLCTAQGDPHFKTFDGQWIHYYGICKYTMAKYRGDDTCKFDIEVKNEHRHGNSGPSYARLIDLKIFGNVYRLHQGRKFFVNEVLQNIPYEGKEGVRGYFTGNVLQVDVMNCDVSVSFDGNSYALIKLGGHYRNKTKGICGNCDRIPNDYRTADGIDVSRNPNAFNLIGDSYQVMDDSNFATEKCKPAPPQPKDACEKDADRKLIKSSLYCDVDHGLPGKFQECLKSGKIQVQSWKESCEDDLCFNAKNKETMELVKCQILKSLIEECDLHGYNGIDWRTYYKCPKKCGPNQEYVVLANPCPVTCEQMQMGIEDNSCPELNRREGCQCLSGFVEKGDTCVPIIKCRPGPTIPPPTSDPQCLNLYEHETFQDSTLNGFTSNKAVDNNKNQNMAAGSCSQTLGGNTETHWWAVSLNEAASFNNIRIYNRMDCCTAQMNNLFVFTSNKYIFDPNNPLDGMTECASFKTSSVVPGVIDIYPASKCIGRYALIVMKNGGNALQLCEVQLCNRVKHRKIYYHKFVTQLTWKGAVKFCKKRGGKLANIYSIEEQKAVMSLSLTTFGYWVDMKYKVLSEITTTEFSYWGTNKFAANTIDPSTLCTMLYGAEQYKWNAYSCDKRLDVICEFEDPYVEEIPCICSANGDPHFLTFDKQVLHYYGICKYTLASYNDSADECDFDVEIKNERRLGNTVVSYVRLVDIKMFGHTFRLHQRQAFYVDDKQTTVPYYLGDDVAVFYSGGVLQFLSSTCDVAVSFDGVMNTFVKTGAFYKRHMTGICGDCDGKQNDYRTREGKDVSRESNAFNLVGDSYKVFDDSDTPVQECLPSKPLPKDFCQEPEYQKILKDPKVCGFDKITLPKLKSCLSTNKAILETWIESCEADVCLNLKTSEFNLQRVRCTLTKGLIEACNNIGIIDIEWREYFNCPLECGDDKEYVTSEDPCPLDCDDMINGVKVKSCPEIPRREGCQCKKGFLLRGKVCVREENCQPGTKIATTIKPDDKDDTPCTCSAVGDPHFQTYDGQWIHYYGVCKYTLSKYSGEDDRCSFSIEVKNEYRNGNSGPSYVRLVDIKMFNHVWRLHQGLKLFVDNKETLVPHKFEDDVKVFYSGNLVEFSAPKCDVWVSFDGNSNAIVKVSRKYSGKLTGLCGDCDRIQNDYRTKDGLDVSKEAQVFNLIGDSFQVKDDSDKPEICKKTEPQPKDICTDQNRPIVQDPKNCGFDKAPIAKLQTCLNSGKLNVAQWKLGCEADLCFNAKDQGTMTMVKCEIIEALIAACIDAGFLGIDWRRHFECPILCGKNQIYELEMDPCPLTCEDVKSKATKKTCPLLPKREGCKCAKGFLLLGKECVKEETCQPEKEIPLECKDVKGEIVLLLDSSSSVGDDNWRLQLGFVTKLVNSLKISETELHLAFVTFNMQPKLEFGLNTFYTKAKIVDALGHAEYSEGPTYTGAALKFIGEEVLKQARPNLPKIIILITDGKSNDETYKAVEQGVILKKAGVIIIPLGITNEINRSELTLLSSNGEFEEVEDFKHLNDFVNKITKATCDAGGGKVNTVAPSTAPLKPERAQPCTCSVNGDPHYKTFDGQWINFMGACKYSMAKYNGTNDLCHFEVLTKNEYRGVPGPSYVRHVDVNIFQHVYRLSQGRKLYFDKVESAIPYADKHVEVFYSGNTLQLQSVECKVSVAFDGNSNALVEVDGRYAQELSGICGNCDSLPNDLRTKSGMDVSKEPNAFNLIGDSYQISDDSGEKCESTPPLPDKLCDSPAAKEAIAGASYCALEKITEPSVKACFDSGKLTLADIKKSCEIDICFNLKNNTRLQEVRCEIIEAVMQECRSQGFVKMNWRGVYRCPLTCPENSEFSLEVNPCPVTCEHLRKGIKSRTCVGIAKREGCQCAEGYVQQGGNSCVKIEICKQS